MSSSDEASSFTGSEVEKLSAPSSPNNSPCVNTLDKWTRSPSNDIVVDVLTPPREEDSSNITQALASELEEKKPKGRLKFFKDGLLCLELLHHDEGRSIKWVQSKARTVIPPVVRIAKEAKIPCQSVSALFPIASPLKSSSAEKGQNCARMILPTREARKCGWRKSNVPERGVSSEFTFYMKPAPCVHFFVRDCNSGQIPSSLRRRPCNVHTSTTDRPYKSHSDATCNCEQEDGKIKKAKAFKAHTRSQRKSILLVLDNLSTKILLRGEESVRQSVESPPSSNHIRDEQSRVLRKPASSVSKKKSRSLDLHESYSKPILNVPGAFKKFKTKSSDKWSLKPPSAAMSFPFPLPMALSMVYGSSDVDPAIGSLLRTSSTEDKVERLRKNLRTNRNRFGAKESIKSDSTLSTYREKSTRPRDAGISLEYANSLKANASTYLSRENEDLLKQRTISTAISYTINSLLGNGQSSAEESCDNDTQKYRKASNMSPVDNHKHGRSTGASSQPKLSTEDQTLFLRHLLDTSDPIPPTSASAASECSEQAPKLCSVEKTGCNQNGKEERAYKRKSPKSATVPSEHKNKVLITDKSRKPDISSAAHYGSSGRQRYGKSEDVVSAFHRHNPSAGISAPFPVFNSTSHRPNFNFTCDTALNLCRRETSPSTNGIIDLSLSSKNRASNPTSDQRWCVQNGGSASFDEDVPLNLSKNARTN